MPGSPMSSTSASYASCRSEAHTGSPRALTSARQPRAHGLGDRLGQRHVVFDEKDVHGRLCVWLRAAARRAGRRHRRDAPTRERPQPRSCRNSTKPAPSSSAMPAQASALGRSPQTSQPVATAISRPL